MTQHLQMMQSANPLQSVERKSYFLQLPGHNIFSLILFNAFLLIIAMPLIIINAGLLGFLPDQTIFGRDLHWLNNTVSILGSSPSWLSIIQTIVIIIIILLLFLPLCRRCIGLIRYYLRPRPTDEEYDAWVRSYIPVLQQEGLRQLAPDQLIDRPECLQGIVWPGSEEDAQFYRPHDSPVIKWDRSGAAHVSINRFVFFYPISDVLAVFTCDVNALANRSYSKMQRYHYKNIAGFEIYGVTLPEYPMYELQRLEIQAGARSLSILISNKESGERIVNVLNALLRDHR